MDVAEQELQSNTIERIKNRPRRLFEFIKNNKCRAGSWLCGICSAWFGVAEYSWEKCQILGVKWGVLSVIVPLVVAGVLSGIAYYVENKDIKNTDIAKDDLSIESIKNAIPTIVSNFVIAIYESLGLSEDDRITLYLSDKDDFLPCARYSRNPNICSIKRPKYSKSQGVIKKVWENDWWFDNEFPDPNKKSAYQKYHREQYQLSANDVKKLSMKAIFYCGKRISDYSGREPIAVLIIESTRRNRFEKEEIHIKLIREVDKLVPLLENETIRSCIPNQSIIEKEEGF